MASEDAEIAEKTEFIDFIDLFTSNNCYHEKRYVQYVKHQGLIFETLRHRQRVLCNSVIIKIVQKPPKFTGKNVQLP